MIMASDSVLIQSLILLLSIAYWKKMERVEGEVFILAEGIEMRIERQR